MGDSPDVAFAAARFLANVINPVFLLLLLSAPFPGKLERNRYLRWFMFCCLGVAVPVVLAEAGKRYQVWSGHPWFPSGHETFAASAATCLIVGRSRWAAPAVGLAAVMAWALVRAHFHDVDDVVGALVLGPMCAVGIAAAMRLGRGDETSPPTLIDQCACSARHSGDSE